MSATSLTLTLLLSTLCLGTSIAKELVSITITDITLDITGSATTLVLCDNTNGPLPDGDPKLIYGDVPVDQRSTTTVEGTIDGNNPNCANFAMDSSFILPAEATLYQLLIVEAEQVNGRWVSTFAMTVSTTLLICGEDSITKVAWSDQSPTTLTFSCIDSNLDNVCYYEGVFDTGELCFTITDTADRQINICMNGLPSATVDEGSVSVDYLYYGPADGTGTLSLTTPEAAAISNMRAIIRMTEDVTDPPNPGAAGVYDCPDGVCSFSSYTPISALYDVCVESMDDSQESTAVANTTFSDMNLNVFNGGSQSRMLLEFVFANNLEDKTYTGRLFTNEPDPGTTDWGEELGSVDLDCTAVTTGHACFGFLDTGSTTEGTVYLALSDQQMANTIVIPFTI